MAWRGAVQRLGSRHSVDCVQQATPRHRFDGIAAYSDHPVRSGVAESLNTTIKAVLRRARGMHDKQILVLKSGGRRLIPSALHVTSSNSLLTPAAFDSVKSPIFTI
jgi:hypothetical protein